MTDAKKDTPVSPQKHKPGNHIHGWGLFLATTIGVFLLGMLLATVLERRNEAKVRTVLQPVDEFEVDAAKWGVNWPRQYSSYQRMSDDHTETLYGGAYPRDYLEESPDNVIMFSGYGFSKQFLQARGHTYTIEDVTETARVGEATPATCWTCKGPDVPRMMAEFGRDHIDDPEAGFTELISAGAADFYGSKFQDLKSEITHPVGCLDCHDPETMELRISRPALREAFERQGRDIEEVSHQEMRSLVCAQCHVEYYFQGEGKYLTFPWDGGEKVEDMEEYYQDVDHTDWTHAVSGAPMVKMQHPDYELYMTGVHAYRNVACADCHMPYRTEGGVKFTDHHVQSPLLNIANSCSVCHRWGEEEILARVEMIQNSTREARTRAERAITQAHFDIAACVEAGATDVELALVRDQLRSAQLRWDYIGASNGMGFHSPQESIRVLSSSIEQSAEARLESSRILARHGYTEKVNYPDVSTGELAQAVRMSFIDGHPPKLLAEQTPTEE
jgi:nitrite reductase (cytochrome c-552)